MNSGFFYGLLQLMRPAEWSKSFGNMIIAAIIAAYSFQIELNFFTLLIGIFSVVLLWSGLYALNDFTDRKADALHEVKMLRPIPSGKVPAKAAFLFSLLLIIFSFAIGIFFLKNSLFLVCLAAMLLNQIFYSTAPFSFKKRPLLDLVSGSAINPFFRFYAGWVLFVPAFNAPLLALLFILCLQFGGFGLYRMGSKEHEKKLGLRSSVVLFGEKIIKRAAYVSIAVGAFSYLLLCFTVLPAKFLVLLIASLLAFPFYKPALKKPTEMDLNKMYRTLYIHYLLFIAGFVLLYFF